MRPARTVPEATRTRQALASTPEASAWVSANAGSGKTTVLTRRVIRLMLAGTPPSRVLCLTFTKAAAATMQNRIFGELGGWARLDDAELAERIERLEGSRPNPDRLRRARRLFADAVETPGGLKILTIHAFCERVLHQFPFEANVPAGFSVLDDRGADELLEAARAEVIVAANREPDRVIGRAVARIIEEAAEDAFTGLLREVTEARDILRPLFVHHGEPEGVAKRLRARLGVADGESSAAIEYAMAAGALHHGEWRAIADALRVAGSKRDHDCAGCFERAAGLPEGERHLAYLDAFLTKTGEVRAPGFITKAVLKAAPDLAERLEAERQRLAALLERRKLAGAAERTGALMTVAERILTRYEAAKRSRGVLDFDDLVGRTVALLERAGAEWVLYKLDQGIDHILVDEAQDTSRRQWRIVQDLAAEFFAGAGARGATTRTLFAVGDEKQSIFSFQGAAPAAFDEMRRHFSQRFDEAGLDFHPVQLTHSFRSTRDVISAVDQVFAHPGNRRGLQVDEAATLHETVRGEEPGRVEVWPVDGPDPDPAIEAWDAPFDAASAAAPAVKTARRIARWVRDLLEQGEPETGARIHAGEIMVLVRARNAVFEAVIRELKREGVPVAGADRLVLTRHIAVMDLMALGRFVLLPADDLTLATVLKTPLIGLDDDHLIRLAPGRSGSLWSALAGAAEEDAIFRTAYQRLKTWIDEAAFKTPFAFYADILARDGGRRALLARLGVEAGDALDEFVSLALDHARGQTPSLEGFLAWIASADTPVKRDMDVARPEVRVMTAHGAKGLEARVVILADTCGAPTGRHDPRLFLVPDGAHPLLLWSPQAAADPPQAALARDKVRQEAAAEHRRLLYVAMTRAEDRLVVAGFEGKSGRAADSWYDMIADALRQGGARVEPDQDGERLVWERTPRTRVMAADPPPSSGVPDAQPDWLHRPAPQEASRRVLRPSEAGGRPRTSDTLPEGAGGDWPLQRGRLVHRLLQSLPALPAGDREAAALRFLARAAPGRAAEHAGLIADVLRVIAHPALAAVFASEARAEVPLVGRLPEEGGIERLVSGRIDRLAVGAREIVLVDFKTGGVRGAGDPRDGAVGQLAIYRALLQSLYPGRAVRAALVFTGGPVVAEIDPAILDAAWAAMSRLDPA